MIEFARTVLRPDALKDEEDGLLIDEALAGCSIAFGRLVRKYEDRLYHDMVPLAGCQAGAFDVIQEAFLLAFRGLDRFRRRSTFYTWLYRIASNAAGQWRRNRRGLVSHDNLDRYPAPGMQTPARQAERKEIHRQVREAIAGLEDGYREVVELRELECCDYQTISRVLGLPIGTVRSRLHRSRSQLMQRLRSLGLGRV